MDIATLGLAVDSRPVAQAEKALNNLADAGARADSTLGRATNNMAGAMERAATAAKSEAAAVGGASQAVRTSAQAHDAHAVAYRNQQAAAEKYLATLRTETAEYGKNRAQIEAMRAAQMGLTAEQQRSAAAMGAQIDQMRAAQGQMGVIANTASAMAGAVAAGFAVERIYAFTKALFDASAAGERIRTTLDFATGGNGARELQYITNLANALGLELTSTAKAFASFQAASRGTTLEGDAARKVFESVTKAAAVMGLTTEQTSGALLALQQMVSKGTVSAEELRGQLGERLPGAFQVAARAMGVTTGELGKMLEQGLIPASEFLPKFAAQLNAELGDASEKAANRLDASVNRIANAWERLKRAAGDSGVAEGFAAAAEGGAASLNGIAAAMEIARQNGEGFTGQAWAAAKAFYSLGNESDRAKVNMLDNAKATKEAEAELKRLQERGDDSSPNIYIRNSYFQLQEYLKELRAAKAAQDALQGSGASNGDDAQSRRMAASAAASRRAALDAERDAEVKAYLEKDARQTREQKIADEIAKAREANAKMLAKVEGDAATQAKLRAALEVEIGNIREKNKAKGGGAAATGARDEANAEIAEFQRGQQVQEEIARRTIANMTAQRAAGSLEEIEYIKAVAEVDAQRNAAAQTALELQIETAQRKANNATQVANLEGQLAVQREKALTREQQLQIDLAEVERKRAENSRNLHNSEITRSTQELAAMVAQNKQAALELETIGLNDRQLQALNETRMDSVIERQREKIAAMEMLDVSGDSADAIELERQKLEELNKERSLYSNKANRQRAVDQEARMYASMWESVDRTAHDVFVNVADSGMDAFERIGKTLKASVLDMLYQMTIRKWMVNIGTSIFGGGFANAANAATGGGIGGLLNLGSAANGLMGIGSTAAGWVGSGVGALFGQTAGNAALGASLGLGTGSSAAAASAAAAAGGGTAAGAGLGASIGAAVPYIGLAIAALSMLGNFKGETRTGGQFGVAFDGSVANERRGQTYTYQGQQFDRDFSGGARNALTSGQAYRLEGDPVAQESAIRGAVAGTAAGINAMLAALGSSAQVAGFSAGLETSGKGRGGVFSGGRLNTGALFGESGKGDNYAGTLYETTSTQSPDFQTALANFTLDLKQSTLQALAAATDIPKTVRDALANVDIEGLTESAADELITAISAQIEGVRNLKAAFDAMQMPHFAALGFDAAAAMAEVAGGFDKLQANLNSYYQNYYSEGERAAILTGQLTEQFAELGYTLPRSREEFRALIQANEALGEAGAATVAKLLGLESAFASLMPAITDAAQAMDKARSAAYSSLQKAVAAERRTLQDRLSAAQEIASTVGSIFDLLHSNVRELRGSVADNAALQARQGNDFITKALATARASGYLPDADQLAEAIAAARAGLDVENFGGSEAERDYAALVLAGKLAALETVAGKQLTDAQKTVRELENQSKQLDLTLDYWQQQIDISNGVYQGVLSVAEAVRQLQDLQSGKTPGGGANTTGGGSTPASGTGAIPRANYGAEEALTSFEKFKAWYTGLKSNADPSKLMGTGYEVPDWLKVSNFGADSYEEKDLFGSYLFFKNNPQYAADYQQILDTGRSSYSTDGSTLQRTDLSKLPKDVADYYSNNRDELLATEGFGLDPVLAYQLYNFGPGQFGLDGKKQSFTEWLQNTKWTPQGLVSNNNVVDLAQMGYSNYNLPRWDTSTGNIIDLDGTIYTPDGKRVGKATRDQLDAVYGPGYKPTTGVSAEDELLSSIKNNIDAAINAGWTAQQLADGLTSTGTSLQQVADAYGISVAQVRENLEAGGATNIPAYRQGTNFVPEDGPAMLHAGEAVIPKEFNPWAGGANSMGDAGWGEVLAILAAIKTATEGAQAGSQRTVELLVSVIDGNAVITAPAPEVGI